MSWKDLVTAAAIPNTLKKKVRGLTMDPKNIEKQVEKVLNELVVEYGDETFISNGYSYYDSAVIKFTELFKNIITQSKE